VRAILDEIRHLEHAEQIDLRAHHRRRQRQVEGAELQLLQHFLVAAELAGPEHDDLGLAAELGVGALGELLGRSLEQRARLTDMAELDFGLRDDLRHGEQRGRAEKRGGGEGAGQRAADCEPAIGGHHRSP
jgi:hypothetical protein